MDRLFGWFFRGFNRYFGAASNGYGRSVGGLVSRKSIVMIIYLALVGATYTVFNAVPGGFVPAQDKQYLIGFAQLPDGATLDRTERSEERRVGKEVSVRVDLGGRRIIKKKKQ